MQQAVFYLPSRRRWLSFFLSAIVTWGLAAAQPASLSGQSKPTSPGQHSGKKSDHDKESENEEPFTFRVPVDVVVVNTIVTDKDGKPVTDLTREDFKVFEDGRELPIHTFALESYKAVQITDETGRVPGARATEAEGDIGSSQPRLISLFMDDLTMESASQFYLAIEAMKKFVTEDMAPGDQVAITAGSGRAGVPFTSDREVLLSELGNLHKKLNTALAGKATCPVLTDLQAQNIFTQVSDGRSEEVAIVETIQCASIDEVSLPPEQVRLQALNIARSQAAQQHHESQYRNQVLLSSLRAHVRSLRHFDAKKLVVIFSDGFLSYEHRFQLQDVVDMALRSGVILNAVDLRGLFTTMFSAQDTVAVGQTQEKFVVLAQKPALFSEDKLRQMEPLAQMAYDTGGILFEDSNDLHAGLKKIVDSQSFYYVLSYSSPNAKPDGRYHKIKLQVNRPGVHVTHRKGYYAPKEQLSFERRKKEDIMEALHAPGNLNEIPMQLSYNYHQLNDSLYQLAVLTRVSIRGMKFLEEDSRHKNVIQLVVVAFDENQKYVDGLEKSMELNLTEPSYAAMLHYGFTSKVDIQVPPGRYQIKAVVRESVHTKMGSLNKSIEVP
ncbi:MAG: VWA domain-containing protein [Acidobacteriota bacterium]